MNDKENIPEIRQLRYKKGELIFKEGDYGVSVYKIISGKVQIFKEWEEGKITLATLSPGEIVGELTFLWRGSIEPRSFSAKALEDSEVEVFHFSRLSKGLEQMPPILKYMAKQSLKRLIRTNKILSKLDDKRTEVEKLDQTDPWASQRLYYRKDADLDCVYRPADFTPKVRLPGWIKDISLGGMKLEVSAKNALNYSHENGDIFIINTVLPNDKELELTAVVVSVNKDETSEKLSMGMCFTDMTDEARKTLGFFLMP